MKNVQYAQFCGVLLNNKPQKACTTYFKIEETML